MTLLRVSCRATKPATTTAGSTGHRHQRRWLARPLWRWCGRPTSHRWCARTGRLTGGGRALAACAWRTSTTARPSGCCRRACTTFTPPASASGCACTPPARSAAHRSSLPPTPPPKITGLWCFQLLNISLYTYISELVNVCIRQKFADGIFEISS